jgi:hypothetical protein
MQMKLESAEPKISSVWNVNVPDKIISKQTSQCH